MLLGVEVSEFQVQLGLVHAAKTPGLELQSHRALKSRAQTTQPQKRGCATSWQPGSLAEVSEILRSEDCSPFAILLCFQKQEPERI